MKLDDILEAYAELKHLKRAVRDGKVGQEVKTQPISGVDFAGKEGELYLVYRITGE